MKTRARALLITTAATALLGLADGAKAGGHPATRSAAVETAATDAATDSARTTSLGSAGGVRYKKATAVLPGDDHTTPTQKSVRAQCDEDWAVLSGGQRIAVKPELAISDSSVTPDASFRAQAWQLDDDATTLTSYAVCLKTAGLTTPSVTRTNLPASSGATDVASCVQGKVVGGGMTKVGEPEEFSLNASYPVDSANDADTLPDDGWRTWAYYSGPGGGGTVVTASCLAGATPTYHSKTVTLQDKATRYANLRCPKGEILLGGGIYVNGAAYLAHVVASQPWDSGDTGTVPEDGWRAGVVSNAHHDLQMTVHAICH